jgi:deoxyadenosine/deoxycytidine kinase
MGILVYIEGGPGVGKTTYCREVGKRLNYRVIEEPVDSNPYLDLFYADPARYAYEMQIYLAHRRIGLQQLGAAEALFSTDFLGAMLDRTLFGDRIFEEEQYAEGNISDLQHHAYLTAVRNMQLLLYPPTILVFLDASPEVAMERIKKRNRGCETGIKLRYLERLTHRYHQFIDDAENGRYPWSHSITVMRRPWNRDTLTEEAWDKEATLLSLFREKMDSEVSEEWRKDIYEVQAQPYRPPQLTSPGNGSSSSELHPVR